MIFRLLKTCLLPGFFVAVMLGTVWGDSLASAQEPPLITDRPDQTESAFTVPPHLFQLEAGWGYGERRDSGARVTIQGFPQALLRFGLNELFELRLGVPGIEIETGDDRSGSSTTRGLVDATLGFKVVLAKEKGLLPQTAFLGTLIVPSGDEEFTSDRVDPSFRFVFSNTLSSRLSLGYNLGILWRTEADSSGTQDTQSLFDWTVALGIAATDRIGVFVEAFGLSPIESATPTVTSFDTGLTYLLTPRLQFDGSASVGLSSAAPDWTVGLGISFRFPHSR